MLVVGATGILRPAVEQLCRDGVPVVAVARDAGRLEWLRADCAGVVPAAADALDPDGLSGRLAAAGGRPASAIVYCPDADAPTLRRIAGLTAGRCVHLLPSRWAVEDDDLARLQARTDGTVVLLGWAREADRSRWHDAAEVSAAALRGWRTGAGAVLGRVRPWQARP